MKKENVSVSRIGVCFLLILTLFVGSCNILWGADSSESSSGGTHSAVSWSHVQSESSYMSTLSLPEESDDRRTLFEGKGVIIDAGHGFGDTGCPLPGFGMYERDLTLILARKLQGCLEADGLTVQLTHDGVSFPSGSELDRLAGSLGFDLDDYILQLATGYSGRTGSALTGTVTAFRNGVDDNGLFSIFERSYYANLLAKQKPANVFISLHINANEQSSELNGFELYNCYTTPHAAGSERLTGYLQAALGNSFPQTPGRTISWDWEEGFAVNKYPDMPSVLIETGYATNPTDLVNMLDENWQNRYVRALADGIERFLLAQ